MFWFLLLPSLTAFIQIAQVPILKHFPKSSVLFDQKNGNGNPISNLTKNITKTDIDFFLEKLKENKRIENERKEDNWDCGEVEWEV